MITKNHIIELKDTSASEMARFRQIMLSIWRQQIEDDKNASAMRSFVEQNYISKKIFDQKRTIGWFKNKAIGKYEWKNDLTSIINIPNESVYIGLEDNSIVYDLFGKSSFKISDWDMGTISFDNFDNPYSAKGAAVYTLTAETTLHVTFLANIKTKYDNLGEIKSKDFLGITIFATVTGTTNAPYPNIGALNLRDDEMSLQGKQMSILRPGSNGGLLQGGDVPTLSYHTYWSASSIQKNYGKSSNLNFNFKGVYFDTDSLKSLTGFGFTGLIPIENTTSLKLSIPFNNVSGDKYLKP